MPPFQPTETAVAIPSVRPQTAPKAPLKVSSLKPAAKPAQLPSTSAKTTVPSRAVTPHPAPAPKSKPAAPVAPKPQRRPAPPVPLSPNDQAAKAVQAALAPLYAAQGTQATGQNTAITNLTQAIIAQLLPGEAQVGGQYDAAIGQQTNLSNSAADALRAANPNTQDQALLSAINAPQAQRDQLAAQNSAAFNGGAAVGQYVGGVLPMSSLQSQKLAAMGLAHQMPAIEGLRGQQALSAALTKQSADRAAIDAMRPDLIQKYQNAYVTQAQKDRYLNDLETSQHITNRTKVAGITGIDPVTGKPTVAATRLTRQQNQFVARQQQQINLFNARQSTEQAKLGLPNAALSGKVGYLVDSTGAPINGKITPLPGNRIVNGQVVKQGSKAKAAPRLTGYQVQKFKGDAALIASRAKSGFDGKDVYGKPKHFAPLSPAGAWQEMLTHGIPVTIAVRAMNRAYGTNFNAAGTLP